MLAQLHLQAGAGCDSMSSPPVVVPVFTASRKGAQQLSCLLCLHL